MACNSLPGLKRTALAGRNGNLRAGARVAANAGLAGADAEDAEAAQLDAVACGERLLEPFEDRIHGGLSLGARQAGTLDNVMYDVLLNQRRTLSAAVWTAYPYDATGFAEIVEWENFLPAVQNSPAPRL